MCGVRCVRCVRAVQGAEAKASGKEAKAAEKPKTGAAGTLHAPMDAFIYEYDDNCEGGTHNDHQRHTRARVVRCVSDINRTCINRTRAGWVLKGKKVLFVLPRSVEIKEDANPASPPTYVMYPLLLTSHSPPCHHPTPFFLPRAFNVSCRACRVCRVCRVCVVCVSCV